MVFPGKNLMKAIISKRKAWSIFSRISQSVVSLRAFDRANKVFSRETIIVVNKIWFLIPMRVRGRGRRRMDKCVSFAG